MTKPAAEYVYVTPSLLYADPRTRRIPFHSGDHERGRWDRTRCGMLTYSRERGAMELVILNRLIAQRFAVPCKRCYP